MAPIYLLFDCQVATSGRQQPINKLTDQLRSIIAQAGYNEALTFALVYRVDNREHTVVKGKEDTQWGDR